MKRNWKEKHSHTPSAATTATATNFEKKNKPTANQLSRSLFGVAFAALSLFLPCFACLLARPMCHTALRNPSLFHVHEVSLTEKNIYMLNYDLTLLFKQFILMLVAVAAAATAATAALMVCSHILFALLCFALLLTHTFLFSHSQLVVRFYFGFVFNKSRA